MGLSAKGYAELTATQKKLASNTATTNEIQKFLNLIEKSGNKAEMSNYTKNIGFNSIGELKDSLKKTKNEDLMKGLAVVGGAVLVAWILTKK